MTQVQVKKYRKALSTSFYHFFCGLSKGQPGQPEGELIRWVANTRQTWPRPILIITVRFMQIHMGHVLIK